MMKNSTCPCTSLDGKKYLTITHVVILLILDGVTLIGNLITNFLVMFIIIKTKQIKSIANKMLFQLSFADFFVALLAQSLYFIAILFYKIRLYTVEAMQMFIGVLLVNVSCYTIALLGLDRFIRIKYKTSHLQIFSQKRVYLMMAMIWVYSLVNAIFTFISFTLDLPIMSLLNSVLETTTAIIICTLHIAPATVMRKIRNTSNNPTVIDKTSQYIIRLQSKAVSLFLAFLGPFLIIVVIYKGYGKYTSGTTRSNMEFLLLLSYQFAMMNSFANALLFLVTNMQSKLFLRKLMRNRIFVLRSSSKSTIT